MSLSDGYHIVPLGKVATIVTHLEMRAPVPPRPVQAPKGWHLRLVENPKPDWYRTLFHDVGSDWLWFSRLNMNDDALNAVISHPDVSIWTLSNGSVDAALLELDFKTQKECELSFFGLAPALIGQGAGRFLMNAAIENAWARPIELFKLQTCTLDSPQALPFYRRSGFTPTHQRIEIAQDPRQNGCLAIDKAPHVPIFKTAES